jgi:hypothetical protein
VQAEDEKAFEDAKRAGFDLNLIDLNLELTMDDRALRHDGALALALAQCADHSAG